MSRFILNIHALLKVIDPTPTALEKLLPPDILINSSSVEEVVVNVIRKDSRGKVLRWEIGSNSDLTGVVEGVSIQSGTLLDSGLISITNTGIPIGNFYLRVRDTARPDYSDGIAEVKFIRFNEVIQLQYPELLLTGLVSSVLCTVTPVPNAVRYILERSIDQITWVLVTSDYDINTQPFLVTSLSTSTTYYFRITATSDSLLFRDGFSVASVQTQSAPVLPTPIDLTFEDLGAGVVRIGVTYGGVVPDTYIIERDDVVVYSGASPSSDISGFLNNVSYVVRAKTVKSGHVDSFYYREVYTHQDVPVTWLTLEQFGGDGYYKRFDSKLNYQALGNGTTRITYTGTENVFDSNDLDKSFCGLFANKNPATPQAGNINLFFPEIEGTRYCKIILVENSKNIIVDFEFNLVKTNWLGYIFHDNSKAFSDVIDSIINTDHNEIRFLPNKTYVIPEVSNKLLPDKDIYIWTGTSQKARVKLGYEDYFKWGASNERRLIKQAGSVFSLRFGSAKFISHNIDWIPPHRRVVETEPAGQELFGGGIGTIGLGTKKIVVVNCNSLVEKEEINDPAKGNFPTISIGTLYSGGLYTGSGINEDVSDTMYLLLKNVKHHGQTAYQLKCSSGAGLMYVAEDVSIKSSGGVAFQQTHFSAKVKLTSDKSGLKSDIISRNYYPSHVLEITSDNSWYQIQSYNTIDGWGNRGNCVQIGGFVFWQTVGNFYKYLYESWYSRGQAKRSWFVSPDGADQLSAKKLMIHSIPRNGEVYTVGRSYSLGAGTTIENYRPSRIRGNINWCAVMNKRWDQINPSTEIPANCIPLEFQPGDRFKIIGQGETIYKVVRTDRLNGSGTDWVAEPRLWGRISDESLVYYASEYFLDKDLPPGLGLTFQIEMIESKAEILFDGQERDCYLANKGNVELRAGDVFLPGYVVKNHDENTDMLDGNIINSSSQSNHASYNHEEIGMWARNLNVDGFHRESNNGEFGAYTILNAQTGQTIEVSASRKYSKGYTLINSSGLAGEFTPVNQFLIRDLIRKSQGINLAENLKEKVRLYACTNMSNLENTPGPYVEVYPTSAGAPDMPAVCRSILNSLPN